MSASSEPTIGRSFSLEFTSRIRGTLQFSSGQKLGHSPRYCEKKLVRNWSWLLSIPGIYQIYLIFTKHGILCLQTPRTERKSHSMTWTQHIVAHLFHIHFPKWNQIPVWVIIYQSSATKMTLNYTWCMRCLSDWFFIWSITRYLEGLFEGGTGDVGVESVRCLLSKEFGLVHMSMDS